MAAAHNIVHFFVRLASSVGGEIAFNGGIVHKPITDSELFRLVVGKFVYGSLDSVCLFVPVLMQDKSGITVYWDKSNVFSFFDHSASFCRYWRSIWYFSFSFLRTELS